MNHNRRVLHGCRLVNDSPEEVMKVQASLTFKERRLQTMQQKVELAEKAKVSQNV